MLSLVDSNILVYLHDPRDRRKKRIAGNVLRRGIEQDDIRVPHQAIVEFVAATSRPLAGGPPLLSPADARLEAEALLHQYPILYPSEEVLRTAFRGAATYGLSWFDAHLWAYADVYGLDRILSEDFQHGRLYGRVEAFNPFAPEGREGGAAGDGKTGRGDHPAAPPGRGR